MGTVGDNSAAVVVGYNEDNKILVDKESLVRVELDIAVYNKVDIVGDNDFVGGRSDYCFDRTVLRCSLVRKERAMKMNHLLALSWDRHY